MLGLGLVTLVVRDYDEAVRFFVDTMGFELVQDTPLDGEGDGDGNHGEAGKRWIVVRPAGGPGASLLLARADGARQEERVGDQTGGRVGFFLTTDDFGRQHQRMVGAGVRFLEPPRHEPYGTVAVFADLYGNRWDLIEPR